MRYAQDGFTSVIHGKVRHEETRATASQALKYPERPLPGRPRPRRGRAGLRLHPLTAATAAAFLDRFGGGGVAGLRSRSRPDPRRLRQPDDDADDRVAGDRRDVPRGDDRAATARRLSPATSARSTPSAAPPRSARTRSSRCSTSSRLDLMLVVGGYNSSNTCNLARHLRGASARPSTSPIPAAWCQQPRSAIVRSARRRPPPAPNRWPRDWLPAAGRLVVGLTAGASTPNNIVGEVIERLELFALGRSRPESTLSPAGASPAGGVQD